VSDKYNTQLNFSDKADKMN